MMMTMTRASNCHRLR